MSTTGSGDRLARGASRAAFPPAGSGLSKEQWDALFAPTIELVEKTPAEIEAEKANAEFPFRSRR
jgi:hypothetical protein